MPYSDWGSLLAERFPACEPVATEREWAALKQRLVVGHAVTGSVVAKAPFGEWVDIGVGFPALLEIIDMANLSPERYRADDWCSVGSEATAFVGGFRDDAHQVGLRQVPLNQRGA